MCGPRFFQCRLSWRAHLDVDDARAVHVVLDDHGSVAAQVEQPHEPVARADRRVHAAVVKPQRRQLLARRAERGRRVRPSRGALCAHVEALEHAVLAGRREQAMRRRHADCVDRRAARRQRRQEPALVETDAVDLGRARADEQLCRVARVREVAAALGHAQLRCVRVCVCLRQAFEQAGRRFRTWVGGIEAGWMVEWLDGWLGGRSRGLIDVCVGGEVQ
eukprot:306656-Chlamydomonas_euryale.AAC.1